VTQRVGYLIDVSGISLDEGGGSWIQAMPVGTYAHPVYGDLKFTHERLLNYAASVNNRIRKIDPDIDYDHKARFDHAAGWVKNAEVRSNGLWLYVTWTPTAQQKLRDGEYKYFSPEFQDEWTDPSTGVTYKDVLFGGGLTNRPFLKDLVPINLSEMVGDMTAPLNNNGTGGSPPTDAENMTAMARALGLSGQVTSAHIAAALATRLSEGANNTNNVNNTNNQGQQNTNAGNTGNTGNTQTSPQNITLSIPPVQQPQLQQQQQPQQIVLSVQPSQATGQQNTNTGQQNTNTNTNGGQGSQQNNNTNQSTALADLLAPIALTDDLTGDPVALADVVRRQNERIQMLASATKLADAQAKVIQLCEGSNIALSPAVKDLAIELMVKAPVALSEKVEQLLEAVAHGKATVVLGELGRSGAGSGNIVKQFSDAITKAQKDSDGKLGYAEAMDIVARTQPGLANAYREATMSGEGEVR